jgi:predicted HTH transcriptional regulator
MTLPNAVVKNIEEGGQMGGQISWSIQLTTRQKEILSLIEKDTQISKRQPAQIFKINHFAVDKYIE